MKTIYIVYGSEGNYDDYYEYDIKAFICKDKTEQLVELLKEEAKRVIEHNRKVYEKHPFPKNDGTFRDRRGRAHEGWREEWDRVKNLIESELTENKYDSTTFQDNVEYNIKELELDETLHVEIVEN
jgi:hypothetical protein